MSCGGGGATENEGKQETSVFLLALPAPSAIITHAQTLDGNVVPAVLAVRRPSQAPRSPLYQHFMCRGSIASYYKCNEAEVIEAFIDCSDHKFTAILNWHLTR